MFDIPRLYLSARSNSVQLVPLHPIIISILFHHYKELKECINQVEQIEAKVNNNSKKKDVIKKKEERRRIPVAETTVNTIQILKFLLVEAKKKRKKS